MPELPDVQVFREYLDETALHQTIERVRVQDAGVLDEGTTPQSLGRRLAHRELESTRRHGKNLFAEVSGDGGWLRLHFGMTGELAYRGKDEDPPAHERVRLEFDDGAFLSFVNQRKLGRVAVVDDPGAWIEAQGLGPDALEVDGRALRARLEGRSGTIKGTLMDQAVLAGLGNVYVDELLFQARVHPRTRVGVLDADTLDALARTMRQVLERAIRARVSDFPEGFLLPHRREGEHCPRCGAQLRRLKVSGRTTFLCPEEQPELS